VPPPPRTRAVRLVLAILLAAIAAAYADVAGHAYLNFDDPQYVRDNATVREGLGLAAVRWAFTSFDFYNWAPLTWISHLVDASLLGTAAGPRLVENVLLHAATVLALYAALRRATSRPWPSLFAAGLFALHPLHVQSVAWVSSRKDVLAGLFWMLALGAHVRFAERRALRDRIGVFVLGALGMLAKPVVAMLPFALLLFDGWPLGRLAGRGLEARRRWPGLVVEKAPLLAMSAFTIAMSWHAQASGGALGLVPLSLADRLANAALAYGIQLRRMVWPADLSAFHPLPTAFLATPTGRAAALACAAALAGVTMLVLAARRERPWLCVGWLWYLVVFLPTSGLVQLGRQGMADRYAYLPLVGLYVAIAWEGAERARRWKVPRVAVAGVATAILATAAFATHREVGWWRDSATLFTRALAVEPENAVAHNNLGAALHEQGEREAALDHFAEAVRIDPAYRKARENYALELEALGRGAEAPEQWRALLALEPTRADARRHLAELLADLDDFDGAIEELERVVMDDPMAVPPRIRLGLMQAAVGRNEEGLATLRDVVALAPDSADAHFTLSQVLFSTGAEEEGLAELREAARLDPARSEFRRAVAAALVHMGRRDEAERELADLVEQVPDDANARQMLEALRAAR